MKAIQFKKTGQYTGNHDEVTRLLGGTVTYVGQRGREANKTYERDGETFPIQFDDWLVDIEGVILVLSEKQYEALKSVAHKHIEPYRVCRRVNILRDYPDDKTKLYPRN
ncbi:hypothetical protein [Acinetobacter seifertii]|uniref:hypothetical protein n=1 Tax=Acinetobacter seifertii TaxID=1530123 RepID=UPI00124FD215|nr:hypothetical protein [Acinetobacter seifertii]